MLLFKDLPDPLQSIVVSYICENDNSLLLVLKHSAVFTSKPLNFFMNHDPVISIQCGITREARWKMRYRDEPSGRYQDSAEHESLSLLLINLLDLPIRNKEKPIERACCHLRGVLPLRTISFSGQQHLVGRFNHAFLMSSNSCGSVTT
jgi:hypothetical protein